MTQRRLVIVGAGGHGREILDIVDAINAVSPTFDFVGFVDDGRTPGTLATPFDWPILGGIDVVPRLSAVFVPAIGIPEVRQRVVEALAGVETVDLVHPLASMGSHVSHGPGLVMAAGARLTHNVRLGRHVHLNVNATVSHDCQVGDYVTVTPGAHVSGNVRLADRVWMGLGSSVIQGVSIGEDVVVGAGAAVVYDLPAGCTAAGVPAHPLRGRQR